MFLQLLGHLEFFSAWKTPQASQEQRENLLELLRKVIQLSSAGLLEHKAAAMFLRDTVATFLGRQAPSLHFKLQVLDLLPIVLKLSSKLLEPVCKAVKEMVVHDFPFNSTDLAEDSTTFVSYLYITIITSTYLIQWHLETMTTRKASISFLQP